MQQKYQQDLDNLEIDKAGKGLLKSLLEIDPKKRSWDILEENEWLQ